MARNVVGRHIFFNYSHFDDEFQQNWGPKTEFTELMVFEVEFAHAAELYVSFEDDVAEALCIMKLAWAIDWQNIDYENLPVIALSQDWYEQGVTVQNDVTFEIVLFPINGVMHISVRMMNTEFYDEVRVRARPFTRGNTTTVTRLPGISVTRIPLYANPALRTAQGFDAALPQTVFVDFGDRAAVGFDINPVQIANPIPALRSAIGFDIVGEQSVLPDLAARTAVGFDAVIELTSPNLFPVFAARAAVGFDPTFELNPVAFPDFAARAAVGFDAGPVTDFVIPDLAARTATGFDATVTTDSLAPFQNTVSIEFNNGVANEQATCVNNTFFGQNWNVPFTVAGWVYKKSTSGATLFVKGNGGVGDRGTRVYVSSSGRMQMVLWNNLSTVCFPRSPNGAVPDDQWSFVALVYDGSGASQTCATWYVNGVDVGSDPGNSADINSGTSTNSLPCIMGRVSNDSTIYYDYRKSFLVATPTEWSAAQVKEAFGLATPYDWQTHSDFANFWGLFFMGNGPNDDLTMSPAIEDITGNGNNFNVTNMDNSNVVSDVPGAWAVMLGENDNYTLTGNDIITWLDTTDRGTDFGSDGISNRPDNTGSLDSKAIANFDGVDERLRNTSPPVTNPDEISVVTLFRRDSAFASTDAIWVHRNTSTVYIRLIVDNGGGVSLRYRTSSLGSERTLNPGSAVVNQWHIASGILNRDQDQRARLDGGNEVSATNNDTAGNLTANAWSIGCSYSATPPSSPGAFFDGQIAAVIVLPYAYDSDVIRVIEENLNAAFGDPVTLV